MKIKNGMAIALLCTTLNAMAAVTIKSITIPDGDPFYSFKIHSSIPANNYRIEEMPLRIGFERINTFLNGITKTENAYLEFGYFDINTQNTTWFPTTCKIPLNTDRNIAVTITKNGCQVS